MTDRTAFVSDRFLADRFPADRFLAEDRGAVSLDRLCLVAAGLLLLGYAAYELLGDSVGSRFSTDDPGVAAFAADLKLAGSADDGAARD